MASGFLSFFFIEDGDGFFEDLVAFLFEIGEEVILRFWVIWVEGSDPEGMESDFFKILEVSEGEFFSAFEEVIFEQVTTFFEE